MPVLQMRTMNQTEELNRHHRRNLPHFEREDAVYFMTVCLKGALPKHRLEALKNQRTKEQERLKNNNFSEGVLKIELAKIRELYFGKFDDLLDGNITGVDWLSNEKVATVWNNALFYFDKKRYKVICSTIMSNHVHFIFYKLTKTLSSVMSSIKGYSANEANKIINNTGKAFWQDESFDRRVRNRMDLKDKIQYVLNNPVKAGLVKDWRDWQWNYIRPEFKSFL